MARVVLRRRAVLRSTSVQEDLEIVYRVPRTRRGWELCEETMPESCVHDEAVELLKAVLAWWASRRGNTHVARNLAVRWDEDEPRVGVDPDVSAFSPPPPREKGSDLRSVRTWLPGHTPPLLAVEVVSTTNPNKDYTIAPDKYAASGTRELWIFDPLLAGPASHGGPFRLQLWQRNERGAFVRAYAGEGPFFSDVAGAYVIAVDEGVKVRLADDAEGRALWPTQEEHERAEKEHERAEKEAAQARVAALEDKLRSLEG